MVIRVISGDNELQALDFQKHYRMPAVYLMDPDRSFEKQYNKGGWPFLMLVNAGGNVVYQCNNLAERDKELMKQLHTISKNPQKPDIRTVGLTPYLLTTLESNGETEKAYRHERFTSIACGINDDVYTVYTTEEDGDSNVYLRIQKGTEEPKTVPVAATDADEYDGTVITDAQGKAWVCWTSNHPSRRYNIYLSNIESILNQSPPVLISQSKEDAMHGRMAVDASNNIWITYYKWQRIKKISRDKEVYLRKYANGSVSTEIHISPDDVSEYEDHTDPSVAVLNDQPVVCWSWDFHKPKGYTQEAETPTVFVRSLDKSGIPEKAFHVSAKNIDMTPVIERCGDSLWCVWDSLSRQKKSLCIRNINTNRTSGGTTSIVQDMVNVCSPDFAFHNDTKGTLTWSQTDDGQNWSLWNAEYNTEQKKWKEPVMVVSEGNPRFGSCAYDPQGRLWIACSVQTDDGRRVVVKQSNEYGNSTNR